MNQISFTKAEYTAKWKKKRRELSLEEMKLVATWKALVKVITGFSPVVGCARRPYLVEAMQRTHLTLCRLGEKARAFALMRDAPTRREAKLVNDHPHMQVWSNAGILDPRDRPKRFRDRMIYTHYPAVQKSRGSSLPDLPRRMQAVGTAARGNGFTLSIKT
jgi:hypothetical protein